MGLARLARPRGVFALLSSAVVVGGDGRDFLKFEYEVVHAVSRPADDYGVGPGAFRISSRVRCAPTRPAFPIPVAERIASELPRTTASELHGGVVAAGDRVWSWMFWKRSPSWSIGMNKLQVGAAAGAVTA